MSRSIRATVAICVAATSFAVSSGLASAAPRPRFTAVGTHPGAHAQSTAQGRQILDLAVVDGQIYAGYGDFGFNTGPITVASLDPASGAFTSEFVADTEATFNLRSVNGRLTIPSIDPRQSADYTDASPWTGHDSVAADHVYDTTTLTGTDRWLVGSQGQDAVAWRSTDGGTTWVEALREPGHERRFAFAAVLDGKLYLQSYSGWWGPAATSRVFDGASWSTGPSLIGIYDMGWQPLPFGDEVVLQGFGQGVLLEAHAFDGTHRRSIGEAYDVATDGTALYVLRGRGVIEVSTDGRKWATAANAPDTARSLTVDAGTIYVGTTGSEILSAPVARRHRPTR